MVHVIGETSNLLLHKAELTILSLPSQNVEKYSTITVLTKKNLKPASILLRKIRRILKVFDTVVDYL